MKKGKMSESGLTGLKDKQDFESTKILKSYNQENSESDNRKKGKITFGLCL